MRTSKLGFNSRIASGLRFKATLVSLFLFALPAFATYERIDNDRMVEVSQKYLGLPYVLGPLGEGSEGRFDADPLSRFDVFDCTTFVETMMALAFSKGESDAKLFDEKLRLIRYRGGEIRFETRNHFTDLDWIPNNISAGHIEDITEAVADGAGGARIAEAVISKNGWYSKMNESSIEVPDLAKDERQLRLRELHAIGGQFHDEVARVPYVHLETIFERDGGLNEKLLARIPNGAVVNMVRPNWDLTEKGGTHQNISHQTIAVWKKGTLYLRQASQKKKKVVDWELADYLRPYLKKDEVKGINILRVLPAR